MSRTFSKRFAIGLSLATAGLFGCDASLSGAGDLASVDQAITDVNHTPVERQSIGNCWLYSQATWVESMVLSASGEEIDVSQSYWTYWHWFDQVTGFFPPSEIQTGGFQFTSHQIVRDRGLMLEDTFVPEDSLSEMSDRQASALAAINLALANGEFQGADGATVRQIFDDAWGLSPDVRAQLDQVFGVDGERTLRHGASVAGTDIVDPTTVGVRYTDRLGGASQVVDATLVDAIDQWREVRYPFNESARREFLRRVQRALHDRQPVVITWDVDFNALESFDPERQGSFNMQTLREAGGPGGQGGHMTVLEDYEAVTEEFGVLEAGVTLDPSDPADAAKLEAALLDSTRVTKLRVKNSWGASRDDRGTVPGFPGYHDLWMDYLNGPIAFCPGEENPTAENCTGESIPLRTVMLPPGY